jgi:hypothetical protein
MKTLKIFLLLFIGLMAGCAVNAQKVIEWNKPTSASKDSLIDTGTVLNTFMLVSAPDVMLVEPTVTKVSGTVAGYTVLEYSVLGDNWKIQGDTLHHGNATTNHTIWTIANPGAPLWRTRSVGTGTMKARVKVNSHTKKK